MSQFAGLPSRPFAEAFPPENIRHYFVGQDDEKGMYAKEVRIPAGTVLVSHKHLYDHLSILASGCVTIDLGNGPRVHHGPSGITIRKGVEHTVHALTDAVWFCIHPTDETDATKIDEVLISSGSV